MPRRLCMIVLTAVAPFAAAERVDLFTFENADGADVSGLDLWVDIVDHGTYADFVFHNDSTIPSFVRSIYVERTDFTGSSITSGRIETPQPTGVYFRIGAAPGNPPGAIADFGGAWQGNILAVGAKKGGTGKEGIDPGEHVVLQFDYQGISFQQLVDGLRGENPRYRIVQHVQGIGGSSVWNMNDRTVLVPLPGAGALAAAALGLGAVRRRR